LTSPELIRALADDLIPVRPGKTRNDLLVGLGLGAAVSLVLVLVIYGVQPGLLSIARGGPMVMKVWYALPLAAIAGSMLLPMLRPGDRVLDRRKLFAASVVLLAGLALWQTTTSNADPVSLWLGLTWQQSSLRIAGISVPVFAGACWAIRRQAPLRLRATGALAGLVSGGIAATVYAPACNESGAGFVLVWYTLGIAVSTAFGAITGPYLLRW
jgi:hypothetical protein